MRIQHNIMALNAYRNYNNNTKALSGNLEKLSSGYKINRAGDDAAGLAISEKMRAQITGLDAAQKNVKDGISLVKTAEGAMQEIQDMLNRMDYLATQSANGTYQNEVDRENLQKEVKALKTEIDRIADSANFNGIKLLDGSKDAKGVVAGTGSTSELKNFTIPDVGTVLGTNTVLHAEAATSTTGTEFSVDLHNITFDNRTAGNKLTMNIGGGKLELEVLKGGTSEKMAAGDIANAIRAGTNENYKVTFTPAGSTTATELNTVDGIKAEFKGTGAGATGQSFTIGGTGNKLTFTQDAAPTSDAEVVAGDMAVSITASVKPVAKVDGKAVTAADIVGNSVTGTATNNITAGEGTVDATNLDKAAIADVAAAVADIADGDLKIGIDGNKLQLVVGDKVVGEATADITWGNLDGAAVAPTLDVEFQSVDGKNTALGKVTITGASTVGKNMSAADFATPLDSGLDFALAAATPAKSFDASPLAADTGKSAIIAAAAAAEKAGTTVADGKITIAYNAAGDIGKKMELKVGNTVIGTADEADINTKMEFKDADGNAIATVNTTGTPAVTDFTRDVDTGLTYTAPGTATNPTVIDYNVSTTDINNIAVGQSERLASTKVTVTKNMISEGSSIQIGKETYVFKVDKDSTLADSGSTKVVDVSDLKSSDASYISDVLTRLTDKAAGNTTYTVGHNGTDSAFTITEKKGQTDYVDKNGKSSLTSKEAIAATLGYKGLDVAPTKGESLTLQIGDTAETFNQLQVDIKDMHVAAMKTADGVSIEDIDIGTQKGAQEAVDVIKNAINYVSSVRGDLGAIQNRLDHTANNLSVMAENIQDAESTIRDTDVASEMMKYVKNNILVQSAQAMLAQANQVPQGVLQLLG